ncbi:MAG: AAA family ATPase [Proteobacteria bacterium]|nr:AAA family ATPase [Pseudomonadota bacterium]
MKIEDLQQPTIAINTKKTFGVDCNLEVKGFADKCDLVPEIDPDYVFDSDTTIAVLAGFAHNQRVLLQGMHGSGKSTHIEQIAARLNWPVLRINFDSQITRMDLVGKDVITIKEGQQVTEFKEGIIPYAARRPVALVLDEYDAIKTDVSFVIQRLLEQDGKFALLEENAIITPHPFFRLFATSNTIGMGDDMGIYHGTNLINQGQMDRWNIVTSIHYLTADQETKILLQKMSFLKKEPELAKNMVQMAALTREGFRNSDLSSLMSLRTLISWADNYQIFGSVKKAFIFSFLNKVIEEEKLILNEYYQRIFGEELIA